MFLARGIFYIRSVYNIATKSLSIKISYLIISHYYISSSDAFQRPGLYSYISNLNIYLLTGIFIAFITSCFFALIDLYIHLPLISSIYFSLQLIKCFALVRKHRHDCRKNLIIIQSYITNFARNDNPDVGRLI